jgi:phage tail sheath protein FI
MSLAYKHGIYGTVTSSSGKLPPEGVSTLPVYIGTAPVNQAVSASVSIPVLVSSFEEAIAKFGWSDDWAIFTLCEAIYAHFKNPVQPIGPIILINVMDPSVDQTTATTSVSITFTNKIGYVDNQKAILSTCAIATKVINTDFKVEYVWKDGKYQIKVTDISTSGLTSPQTMTFKEMDITKVDENDIVGGYNSTTDARLGLSAVDLIYPLLGAVPTILAAPGWGHKAAVYNTLLTKCQDINGHWDTIFVADIDSTSSGTKAISAAKTNKTTNVLDSKYCKLCWPKVKYNGKTFWLSTIAVVAMQQTDFYRDNIPFESPSNKKIMAAELVAADGTAIKLDEVGANILNEKGITTAIYTGGAWRLWGPHMANYDDANKANIQPEDYFDSSIRMIQYLSNSFQKDYMGMVDNPFDRRQIETILDSAQIWLNGLVAQGAVLYAEIQYNKADNPTADVAAGEFVFKVKSTTIPPGKAITFNIQYDTTGLSNLTGGAQ